MVEMKKNVYVSVSLDPIKEYQKMVEYAKKLQGHADLLHCDIMDGKFVSNKTYSIDEILLFIMKRFKIKMK